MGLDLIFFIVQTEATGLPCTLSCISTVQRYVFPATFATSDVIFQSLLTYLMLFPQRRSIMLTFSQKEREKAKISRFQKKSRKRLIFTVQCGMQTFGNKPKYCRNFVLTDMMHERKIIPCLTTEDDRL